MAYPGRSCLQAEGPRFKPATAHQLISFQLENSGQVVLGKAGGELVVY